MRRLAALVLLLLAVPGCRRQEPVAAGPPRPVIVIGVDGAEWDVIRTLWSQGKLPNLKRLAERGTQAVLRTEYAMSPVIWTTIATGRPPRVHGITDFVVPTPQGDVPVSSTLRRVPALWNMASSAGKRVAVVSWWASWPAEPVRGVVVSDRATLRAPDGAPFPDGVSPAAFRPRFDALRAAALARPVEFGGNPATAERDQVTAEVGRALAAERYDLLLVYFRGVDVASHLYWRYLHPEGFGPAPPGEQKLHGDEVPRVYAATDAAIGRIVAAAPEANVLVMSDHGFRRLRAEEAIVTLDLDGVLEKLGYLRRGPSGTDWAHTRVSGWSSSPTARFRKLRFALAGRDAQGTVRPADEPALAAALGRDLARVTWDGGQPAFRLRPPRDAERAEGADLVAVVLQEGASPTLRLDGKPWAGVSADVSRISGSHGAHTNGIFVAAGPDVVRAADVQGIHVHDMAPTILYAAGLPVADDFPGRARVELFTAGFRRAHPLRHVATWGAPRTGRVTASAADAALVKELKALGYLR